MPTYRVTRIATGATIYEYQADAPIEWVGMEFATHAHAEVAPPVVPDPGPVTRYGGRRRVTHQEFLDLLGAAFVPILALSKQSVEVEAWVMRFQVAQPDESGYPINLDDPLTVAGLNALEPILIAQGVVAAGWAQGVLNG